VPSHILACHDDLWNRCARFGSIHPKSYTSSPKSIYLPHHPLHSNFSSCPFPCPAPFPPVVVCDSNILPLIHTTLPAGQIHTGPLGAAVVSTIHHARQNFILCTMPANNALYYKPQEVHFLSPHGFPINVLIDEYASCLAWWKVMVFLHKLPLHLAPLFRQSFLLMKKWQSLYPHIYLHVRSPWWLGIVGTIPHVLCLKEWPLQSEQLHQRLMNSYWVVPTSLACGTGYPIATVELFNILLTNSLGHQILLSSICWLSSLHIRNSWPCPPPHIWEICCWCYVFCTHFTLHPLHQSMLS